MHQKSPLCLNPWRNIIRSRKKMPPTTRPDQHIIRAAWNMFLTLVLSRLYLAAKPRYRQMVAMINSIFALSLSTPTIIVSDIQQLLIVNVSGVYIAKSPRIHNKKNYRQTGSD
jgi:hypothetical protein